MEFLGKAYEKSFRSLSAEYVRYCSAEGISPSDPIKFIDWLQDVKRTSVGPDTWRLYRNAVCSTIECNPDRWSSPELKDKVIQLRKTKGLTKSEAKIFTGRAHGGSKVKSLTEEQLKELSEQLKSPSRTYGILTLLWFKACLITGLRPNEWHEAKLISTPGGDALLVQNAKAIEYTENLTRYLDDQVKKSGMSRFLTRQIPLSKMSNNDKTTIHNWITVLREITMQIQEAQSCDALVARQAVFTKARTTLYSASQRISGIGSHQNITLYTARHMFKMRNKAALKARGFSEDQQDQYLAILMGHSSKKSNYAYGIESQESRNACGAIDVSEYSSEIAALAKQVLTRYS